MRILFVGKRHSTNQDVLQHRFGRLYWIPKLMHDAGVPVRLILVDYYHYRRAESTYDGFTAQSVPAFNPHSVKHLTDSAKALRADLIMASGDCFIGLLALRLARLIGAKFVFDVYDDYRTFAAYRAFLGWDALGFLSRRADLIIYASHAMADRHEFASPHIVIPNGVNREFAPHSKTDARANIGLSSAGRLIGYFGSMTPEHGVNVLLQALAILRARHRDVTLLLCGRQHPATPVFGEGVVYRGFVAHELIPSYLNACDVLALPYLRGSFIDSASSCKIAEYLACRRPIVASRSPNFVRNFPEQARQLDALLVTPGDAEALARSIERQLIDPVVASPPDHMSWANLASRLQARMRDLGHSEPKAS